MKSIFNTLAIVCLLAGAIFNPMLLWAAGLFFFIAIGSAPSGKRVDGKSKNGGLLGGLLDQWEAPAKSCEHCTKQIPKAATKCPNCAGDLSI